MSFKYLGLVAGLFLLAACESATETATNAGAGSTAPAPQTSRGNSNYGDLSRGAVRPGSQEDLNQNVGNKIYFATDRSDLSPDSRARVERWAQWLKQYPSLTVTVQGHADERGTREYNLALGERRASAARAYLEALGIPSSRVGTISYGKEQPEVPGSNESAWQQNRRDALVVN